MNDVTPQALRELLAYDPKTGDFHWKVSINPRAPIGRRAGGNSLSGPGVKKYRVIGIGGKLHRAHRLVWLYFHGAWPESAIDHINGNTLDNRIENLRDVSTQRNTWNLHAAHSNSKSGYLGVDWVPSKKKWRAQIRTAGKKTLLGHFDTAEAASDAYKAAKKVRDQQH